MNKTKIMRAYIAENGADSFGLAIEDSGALALAIIEKQDALAVLLAVSGMVDAPSKRGTAGARYNMTREHTAIIRARAVAVYALPFTVNDIERAYNDAKNARGGKRPEKTRGNLFEEWTAEALKAERNAKQNASHRESGDLRIDGRDIQVKYDRGRF